jgi:hypothetical protein
LVINDAKVIKKELIKGKKPVKPPHLNPFRGNPGVNSKIQAAQKANLRALGKSDDYLELYEMK